MWPVPFRVSLVFALSLLATLSAAAPVVTQHVEAELVSDRSALEPGKPATLALRLKMEPGWHTYWQNPGDSGLPTTIDWKLPPGFSAGKILWPRPERIDVGPLTNFGYSGQVFLLNDIVVPSSLHSGDSVTLSARADWLVCREVCIPDGANLSLMLPVRSGRAPASAASPWASSLAQARASLPGPGPGDLLATRVGAYVELKLPSAISPTGVYFFPLEEGQIEDSAPQVLQHSTEGVVLRLQVAKQPIGDFKRLTGVLTADQPWRKDLRAAVEIDTPVQLIAPAAGGQVPVKMEAAAGSQTSISLPLAVLFALLGGLLLNLMPCVFPILSLKVLGFAQKAEGHPGVVRLHGLLFAAGVILSFLALAAILAALRATGTELGWGFQLQSPAVVSGLAILFFMLGLNLSGLFEFGALLPSALSTHKARSDYVNSFFSGVLAAVIAAPCTAPYMGAALGFALTQSTATAYLVFAALGIGMALPYALLAWFPGWLRYLPKAGPWMQRLKELLAFPLYATVVWLIWVLALQVGIDGAIRLLALLVALALVAWLNAQRGAAWRVAAVAVLVGTAMFLWPFLGRDSSAPTRAPTVGSAWGEFTPKRVAELLSDGKSVFVDFTAAWCVTCQVNKRVVLESAVVREAFAQRNITLLRADWTRRDPVIAKWLSDLGRHGVPVYVLYRPGVAPLLLPELLRKDVVIAALKTL